MRGSGHQREDAEPADRPSTSTPDVRRATSRLALLAGLGSTGSLVAAVAIAATVVTGTIAFTSWPGPPSGPGDAEVRLAVPDVPAAVTAAVAATTDAGSPPAGATAADGGAADPGGTPPRPGAADGRGGADPAPSSPRSVTTPAPTVTTDTQPGGGNDGPAPAEDAAGPPVDLGDATELAGKSIGKGVAAGTDGLADRIKDVLPITAGAVQTTGEVSGAAVEAAAEVVADAIRVLPLEELARGGGR